MLVSSILKCENLLLLLVIYDCKWRIFRFFWLSVRQKEAFSRRQFWHFIDLTINQWWKYSRPVAARMTSPLALLHMLCGSLLICDVLLVECAHRWFGLFLTLQLRGQEGYIFVFSAQKKKFKKKMKEGVIGLIWRHVFMIWPSEEKAIGSSRYSKMW